MVLSWHLALVSSYCIPRLVESAINWALLAWIPPCVAHPVKSGGGQHKNEADHAWCRHYITHAGRLYTFLKFTMQCHTVVLSCLQSYHILGLIRTTISIRNYGVPNVSKMLAVILGVWWTCIQCSVDVKYMAHHNELQICTAIDAWHVIQCHITRCSYVCYAVLFRFSK